MRYSWIAGVLLGLVGCASPERIQRGAMAHEQRASQLDAQGDYLGAQREREAAQKQWDKAASRSSEVQRAPIAPPMLK